MKCEICNKRDAQINLTYCKECYEKYMERGAQDERD